MKVTIITENKRVDLTSHPFKLLKEPNLSGLSANIQMTETGGDGAILLNSRISTRDIELEGMIDLYKKDETFTKQNKQLLYEIINPKQPVRIEFEQHKETYFLEALPISFPTFRNDEENKTENYQTFLLQFTCVEPFLYKNEQHVHFSTVEPSFSFPLQFQDVVFGTETDSLIRSVYNDGAMTCPITVKLTATATVKNPYLLNVVTREQININETLQPNDQIIIHTGRKKEVSRIRNGVKTNFFYALALESDFLQLHTGDNVLRAGSETNEQTLKIEIIYQEKVAGI